MQGVADLREGVADRVVSVTRSAEDGGVGIESPSAWRQVDYIAGQDDERERVPSPGSRGCALGDGSPGGVTGVPIG